MMRERSELDAIASEIRASDQPVALDLETYGTSEDKKIRRDEAVDSWRGEIRLLSLQLPDRVPWLIDLSATVPFERATNAICSFVCLRGFSMATLFMYSRMH